MRSERSKRASGSLERKLEPKVRPRAAVVTETATLRDPFAVSDDKVATPRPLALPANLAAPAAGAAMERALDPSAIERTKAAWRRAQALPRYADHPEKVPASFRQAFESWLSWKKHPEQPFAERRLRDAGVLERMTAEVKNVRLLLVDQMPSPYRKALQLTDNVLKEAAALEADRNADGVLYWRLLKLSEAYTEVIDVRAKIRGSQPWRVNYPLEPEAWGGQNQNKAGSIAWMKDKKGLLAFPTFEGLPAPEWKTLPCPVYPIGLLADEIPSRDGALKGGGVFPSPGWYATNFAHHDETHASMQAAKEPTVGLKNHHSTEDARETSARRYQQVSYWWKESAAAIANPEVRFQVQFDLWYIEHENANLLTTSAIRRFVTSGAIDRSNIDDDFVGHDNKISEAKAWFEQQLATRRGRR